MAFFFTSAMSRGVMASTGQAGGGGGDLPLLTLNPANASNPEYQYLDMMDRYLGAFRVPAEPGGYGAGITGWSSGVVAYNPANSSLFMAGFRSDVSICEIAIPVTLGSQTLYADLDELPIASVIQILADGDRGTGGDAVMELAGAYCDGNRLVLTTYEPYAQDDNGRSAFQVWRDPDDLDGSIVDGYIDTPYWFGAGGWVSRIPAEKVAQFGATHLTGFSGSGGNRSTTKSVSTGPAAYATDIDDMIANSATLTGTVFPQDEIIAYYLDDLTDEYELVPQADLYNWSDALGETIGNSLWTALSESSFGILVPGTKTYMVFGSQAMHTSGGWYGNNGTRPPGVAEHPSFENQGPHPRDPNDQDYWYWLYSEDDMLDVINGVVEPWDILPYEWGKLDMPFDSITSNSKNIGSGSFDESTKKLYLTQREWDNTQGMPCPVVTVFDFDFSGG